MKTQPSSMFALPDTLNFKVFARALPGATARRAVRPLLLLFQLGRWLVLLHWLPRGIARRRDAGIHPAFLLRGLAAVIAALALQADPARAACDTFNPAVPYSAGSRPGSVAAADFNRDGYDDLAVTNTAGFSVLFNHGDGTFGDRDDYSLPLIGKPGALAVGDVNGDGYPDIAVAAPGNIPYECYLYLYLNQAEDAPGTFVRVEPPGWPGILAGNNVVATFLAAGSLNTDNCADLVMLADSFSGGGAVVMTYHGSPFSPYLQRAPGGWSFSAGTTLRSGAIGRINSDDIPDLAVLSSSGVTVLRGQADGTYQSWSPLFNSAGSNPKHLALGRFDNNTCDDVAVAHATGVAVLRATSDGHLQTQVTYAAGTDPRSVAVSEFNNDGVADLVTANFGSANVSVLLGNGDGTFQAPRNYAAGSSPLSVAVGRFNRGRSPDLAVANNIADGTVSVLLACNTAPMLACSPHSTPSGTEIALVLNVYDWDGDALALDVFWPPSAGPLHQDIPPSGPPTYDDVSFPQTFALGPCELIKTHLITAALSDGIDTDTCEFTVTVTSPTVSASQCAVCSRGGTTSATTVSPGAERGVTVTASNPDGETMVVTVANYSGHPSDACIPHFSTSPNCHFDVQITGAGTGDQATTHFYYPPSWDDHIVPKLHYYSGGSDWTKVRSSGDADPVWNPTDNLDGTSSGGRLTVVFSDTSTPKITELAGTVFVLAAEAGDTTPPTVVCPPGTSANANANCQAAIPDVLPGVTVSDDVDPSPTVSQSPVGGTLVGLGVHTITVTATDDAGNSSTCTTTFTVVDATPPALTCAPPLEIKADSNNQAIVPDFAAQASATDCNGPVSVIQSPPAGASVGLGVHSLTLTATDAAGNQASCTTALTVSAADVSPTIACPTPMQLHADATCQAAVPNLVPEALVTGGNAPVTVTQSPAAGTLVGLGPHTITLTATDADGDVARCETTLTVMDSTAPAFTCPDPVGVAADENGQAAVPDFLAQAAATDCSGPITQVQSPAAGTLVGAGRHPITLTFTDAAGNEATCATSLTVTDGANLPPSVVILEPCSGHVAEIKTPIQFSGVFRDDGPDGSHTAQWIVWSATFEELVLPATVDETTVSDQFAFAEPGVYHFKLVVADESGAQGEASTVLGDLPAKVIIYDPKGFAFGTGVIDSPKGAYRPEREDCAWYQGKAAFAFAAKYPEGATAPVGLLKFNVPSAKLRFVSRTLEWLVVTEGRAQLQGEGTIGEGHYRFLLTAETHRLSHERAISNCWGRRDYLRLKIWDPATGEVVYDNQPGSDDDAPLDQTTLVRIGSIVIHQ